MYFAGVGWQAFDPTASVPLAGDTATIARRRHGSGPRSLLIALLVGGGLLLAAGPAMRLLARRRTVHRARRRLVGALGRRPRSTDSAAGPAGPAG